MREERDQVLGASEFLGRSVACKDKPDILSAWAQAVAPGACMGSQTEQVSGGQRLGTGKFL